MFKQDKNNVKFLTSIQRNALTFNFLKNKWDLSDDFFFKIYSMYKNTQIYKITRKLESRNVYCTYVLYIYQIFKYIYDIELNSKY